MLLLLFVRHSGPFASLVVNFYNKFYFQSRECDIVNFSNFPRKLRFVKVKVFTLFFMHPVPCFALCSLQYNTLYNKLFKNRQYFVLFLFSYFKVVNCNFFFFMRDIHNKFHLNFTFPTRNQLFLFLFTLI